MPLSATTLERLRQILRPRQAEELEHLEQGLPFLATTASVAPFVGLFGTVWGIMQSFHAIGQGSGASLAVVGPGIADALIATAVGLAAAIPASWLIIITSIVCAVWKERWRVYRGIGAAVRGVCPKRGAGVSWECQ